MEFDATEQTTAYISSITKNGNEKAFAESASMSEGHQKGSTEPCSVPKVHQIIENEMFFNNCVEFSRQDLHFRPLFGHGMENTYVWAESRPEGLKLIVFNVVFDTSLFDDAINLGIMDMTNFRKKMVLYLKVKPPQ